VHGAHAFAPRVKRLLLQAWPFSIELQFAQAGGQRRHDQSGFSRVTVPIFCDISAALVMRVIAQGGRAQRFKVYRAWLWLVWHPGLALGPHQLGVHFVLSQGAGFVRADGGH